MAVAYDASSPAGVFNDTAGTTSLVTASFTPPAGAILVVKVMSADGIQTNTTPTATGHTFTSRANLGTSNASARASLWTATATGSAITVTANFGGSASPRGVSVSVWTGAQLAATPAVATFDSSGAANATPTLNLTTVAANSVVDWVSVDWAAIDGTTRTYRSSATERAYRFVTGQYTGYAASQVAASAGVQTFGLTAPGTQKPTMAGIEIQDSGGGAAAPWVPLIRQPLMPTALYRANYY